MNVIKSTALPTTILAAAAAGPGRPFNPLTAALFSVSAADVIKAAPVLRNFPMTIPIYKTEADKTAEIMARIQAGQPLDVPFLTGLVSPVGSDKFKLADYVEKHGDAEIEIGTSQVKAYLLAALDSIMAKVRELDARTIAWREKENEKAAATAAISAAAHSVENEDADDSEDDENEPAETSAPADDKTVAADVDDDADDDGADDDTAE